MLSSVNPADVFSRGSRNSVNEKPDLHQRSSDSASPLCGAADEASEQENLAADLAQPSGPVADLLATIVLSASEIVILSAMCRMDPSSIESIAESVGFGLSVTTHSLEVLRGEGLVEALSGNPFKNYCVSTQKGREWLRVWGFPT